MMIIPLIIAITVIPKDFLSALKTCWLLTGPGWSLIWLSCSYSSIFRALTSNAGAALIINLSDDLLQENNLPEAEGLERFLKLSLKSKLSEALPGRDDLNPLRAANTGYRSSSFHHVWRIRESLREMEGCDLVYLMEEVSLNLPRLLWMIDSLNDVQQTAGLKRSELVVLLHLLRAFPLN